MSGLSRGVMVTPLTISKIVGMRIVFLGEKLKIDLFVRLFMHNKEPF